MTPAASYVCSACHTEVTTKMCRQCCRVLTLDEFTFKRSGTRTYPSSRCKGCMAGIARIRRGDDALREYTEKEVGVYRGGTWRPKREVAA